MLISSFGVGVVLTVCACGGGGGGGGSGWREATQLARKALEELAEDNAVSSSSSPR